MFLGERHGARSCWNIHQALEKALHIWNDFSSNTSTYLSEFMMSSIVTSDPNQSMEIDPFSAKNQTL